MILIINMNQHSKIRTFVRAATWAIAMITVSAHGQAPSEASPAAQAIPATVTPQTYAPEQIEAGRIRFAADCGFCHGRDAAGGTGGTDLTRSTVVAEDLRGDRIGEVVRQGRPEAGMPSFAAIADSDLAAIVAYVHDQKSRAESLEGGRRSVEAVDLRTGNARAGRRYFEANCGTCHAADGDLADIGARLTGLTLLRRMLYPGSEGRSAAPRPAAPAVTIETADGSRISGTLAYLDEFTIAVTDSAGRYRSWPTNRVAFDVNDPLQAHVEQLALYTDDDIHDVYAFLETLTGDNSDD